MKTVDFSNYKFRCSSLGKLTVGMKTGLTQNQAEELRTLREKIHNYKITDKQLVTLGSLIEKQNAIPTLSNTTKSYLKEIHAREVFGKKKDIQSRYLDKGIMVEEHGITLYSEVTNSLFIKNKERKMNDYFSGECDNAQQKIRDIKCSWDLDTFPMHQEKLDNQDYYWQLQGYMDLWNLQSAELIYCLVDTPEILIEDEKRKMLYRISQMELPQELEQEIENTMRFSDIPQKLRVKVFNVEFDAVGVAALKAQCDLCRLYLNKLSENLSDRL